MLRTLQLQLTKKSISPIDAKISRKDLWDLVTKQLVAAIQEGYTVEGYRLKKGAEKTVQSLKEECNRLH